MYKFYDKKKKKFINWLFISEDWRAYDAYNDDYPENILILKTI